MCVKLDAHGKYGIYVASLFCWSWSTDLKLGMPKGRVFHGKKSRRERLGVKQCRHYYRIPIWPSSIKELGILHFWMYPLIIQPSCGTSLLGKTSCLSSINWQFSIATRMFNNRCPDPRCCPFQVGIPQMVQESRCEIFRVFHLSGRGKDGEQIPWFHSFFQHDFTTQTCRYGDFGRWSAMNFFEFEEAVVVVLGLDFFWNFCLFGSGSDISAPLRNGTHLVFGIIQSKLSSMPCVVSKQTYHS